MATGNRSPFAWRAPSLADIAAAFGFAGAAAAQDQDGATTVDEIIVTAQKREQSLQDVPIVVTSLSQEVLDDAGVRDIKDLQILTPGMTVTSTSSEASTTARIPGRTQTPHPFRGRRSDASMLATADGRFVMVTSRCSID